MSNYNDLNNAAQYIISCMPSPYVLWTGGTVSDGDGPPAWGVNEPPPPASEVQNRGAFCAWVANGMHRHMGLTIPNPYDSPAYDGGIVSYWDAYYDASEWFDLSVDYPDGTFLMSPYNSEAAGDQGHIAMLWHYEGQLYVIEWIFSGATWDYTVEYSNTWGHYSIALRPSVWVPIGGGTWDEGGDTPLPSNGNTEFTVDSLLSIYTENLSRADAEAYFPHMLAAFKEFDISTRERIAAFLGHAVGEVGEFVYWEEIDHGNGRFGEYWGRSPLQCTWYDLYVKLRDAWLIAHPEDPVDFVENPDLVATPEYGFWCSAWYWRNGSGADLNVIADSGDFDTIIQSIYGGYGYDGPYPSNYNLRWAYYNWAIKTLPANLTLGKGEDVPPPPPKDEEYPYGWFGVNEQGYLIGVDVPKGTWASFEKYEDGKLYLVGHSDPAWRKARAKKADEVVYREDNGTIEVKDEHGVVYSYTKEKFAELYEPVEEDKA